MAQQLSRHQEIELLIRSSETARAYLSAEVHTLKDKLDVPARLRDSLRSHPTGWLFGSVASGLAASLLFRRKTAAAGPKKSRSLYASLLGLTLTAAQPLAKIWLSGQVKNYLAGHLAPSTTRNPRSDYPQSKNSI